MWYPGSGVELDCIDSLTSLTSIVFIHRLLLLLMFVGFCVRSLFLLCRILRPFHVRMKRWGQGVRTPPPEKSQKYRVS